MNGNSEAWIINHNSSYSSLAELTEINTDGYVWITVPRNELLDNLAQIEFLANAKINEQHIKDALNNEHPSFFDNTDSYEMVIFRGVAASQFDMGIPSVTLTPVSIASFNFEKILLTVYDIQDPVINKVKEFIKRNNRRATIGNPADLLYKILHGVIEQVLSLRNPLTMQLAEWQKLLLEQTSKFNAWNEFMSFKTAIDQLAVWCEDQEDAIEDWQQYSRYEQQQQLNINLNDLRDHVERCVRFVQKLSSNLDTLIQLHFSALSHRNNEVLRVLAIISCVFLPLTLITGIFGMNFENMPILREQHAYYYTMGIMIMLAFIMLGIFRWRRWL
jgi:magnesium/cobalt transport protein CorA